MAQHKASKCVRLGSAHIIICHAIQGAAPPTYSVAYLAILQLVARPIDNES